MSEDGLDVNSVNPAVENGQHGRSSTRVRKPNSTLDQDGIRMERIRELRKKRGGVLSAMTTKRREIDSLLTDSNNLEPVRVKLAEITLLFRKFVAAHEAYDAELVDKVLKEESNVYFTEIEASMNFFCQTVNDWLRVTEATLHDLQITPNDSISQVSSKSRRKPKASSCGTTSTRSSKTSSITAARAKEAARIAELQAEAHALKQRQLLHETELCLEKQEYDLQLKKDKLKLETEYAKAVAREGAYTQAEAKYLASSDLDSQPRSRVPPPASDIKSATDSTKYQAPQNVPPVKESSKQSKISSSSSDSIKSDLSDQAYQILAQQNRVMEEFVKQQQRNTPPRRRVPTFDGNPLEYCTFMRAFETVIEDKEPDYAGRLYYLEQHTAGRAQEMVRSCLYMKPKEGYLTAKKLLESKFGQKHKIAMAYVDQVTKGPPIKEEDAVSLEGYSILLTSCTNTLKAIGYSKKLEGPDNMRKIIERLPPRLQISWQQG